ncbi:MAG: DUF4388 domain-containing protein [Candidatus Aminicenantes bacterium]|nr:DUF4388 domain-containing protein [Candidatus Aminicenantes bacterium]
MSEETWRGNLATTPFPHILLRIWEKRDTGQLRLQGEGIEKSAAFIKGELALSEGDFSNEGFLKRLLSDRAITEARAEDCARYARENSISCPRAILERGIFAPSRVWEALIEFWLDEIGAVFDWPQADFTFQSGAPVPAQRIYTIFPTPMVILHGIRRMKNHSLIEAFLPAETECLQSLSATAAGSLPLAPHEKHVLGMLRQSVRLQDLYSLSQAGKRETQKVVFAFLTLGLAGVSPEAGGAKISPELTTAGLEKIWNDFNDKCSYIHKSISKEIGPVGLSVLEKALEEVRGRLDPPFRGLELGADGRIEFSPFPLMSLPLSTGETRKKFIRLLNEILVAEILAVKKTLGNAHETALIRNLEKIGESS